jgi:general stress protein 26
MDLQQALFFSESDAVLKFPISIINVLQVDEVGQVWFMVNRPSQHLYEFDREFHARLDFYKKGKDYYMHVKGKACIVTDPEEINNAHGLDDKMKHEAATSMVLIRMKISDAQYYPLQKPVIRFKPELPRVNVHPSALVKSLQYVIKDIIPVFQSH